MTVDVARRNGIVEITLDRPAKRNAMTDAMWSRLDEILSEIEPGGRDRVLVVTGAGGAFCGGSDVGGLLDDLESLPSRIDVSNRCVLAMRELAIPTIAKVDGVAAGSGANLALACDFVIAGARARFAQLFIHRGLSLDSGASWLLPRLVGERRARHLCLLGSTVEAADAMAMGMLTELVDSQRLDTRVEELARTLAGFSSPALAGTKRMLNRSWENSLAAALRAETENQVRVIATDAAREGITSFGSGTAQPCPAPSDSRAPSERKSGNQGHGTSGQ
ncbi:2-(1,2-epoxy-1,2-dihydrophenyl)acetyl-CoA isomerase [Spinactinospora alkalitolerans]|uniref:2-(1,2-epoxy-1,2-dihydrophenyl)acetyl-CoA isomerase n=1 Tax=Spinactinospora alkalitolerans TaxID=687207 RepID=A0A852U0X5_9ACTN|nr:enoyl-CoA hydratase/isomerase family protein [Spinactinospora alkalitolerans]NYE47844.1 2-(1,2-epoxy-1,2-dihydrophenyl)acetyl-CoA isomerase [Spinactinospora alkalitolerans]